MTRKSPDNLLVAVMGPTASGKTGLAEALADELRAVLINADAFQIYRGLDIGTAKPLDGVRYKLLDIRTPNQPFGVGEWVATALEELTQAYVAGLSCVVVGGTGLYIRALFEGYQAMQGLPDPALRERLNETPIEELRLRLGTNFPEIAALTDLANPVRVRRALERQLSPQAPMTVQLPPFRRLKFGLNVELGELNARISHRIDEMLHNGWTQEIERLRQQGYRRDDPGMRAIGYRALWDYLDGKIGLDDAIATTIAETRRYAKRQRTWLRSEPSLVELSAVSEGDTFRQAMERIRTAFE